MTAIKLHLRPGAPPLAWGKPDSPQRTLCAICHGKLPEVPLMVWDRKGACAAFCEDCVKQWVEIFFGK